MSQFTDFFNQAAGVSAGAAGNIFAGIRPPKFAEFGNSHNYSVLNTWKTENFIVPNHLGYALGFNFDSKFLVATWNNTLVWSANDGVTGAGSVLKAVIYNQLLDKWYLATTVAGAGVYEVNILTGARTLVTATVPAFLAGNFGQYASLSYCTADGLYEWRDGDTVRKYNQSFVEVQRRTFVASNNVNAPQWYYTEDCKIRARRIDSWRGQGVSSSDTNTPARPQLLIQRFGSSRLVNLTAEMVFSAESTTFGVTYMTPMAPDPNTGIYLGNAVRLGKDTRNSTYVTDPYLLDRVDYDRWLSDVADALGMPDAPAFYGDWVNV